MKPTCLLLSLLASLFFLFLSSANATLRAYFSAYEIRNLCSAQDVYDPWPAEGPDLLFRMAIFNNNFGSTLSVCRNGYPNDGGVCRTSDDCSSPDNICGTYNFTNRILSKILPNQNDNRDACFYFGLFDDDADQSDGVGDYWICTHESQANYSWVWNNRAAPYYPGNYLGDVCNQRTENRGWSNNYRLYRRIWFEDSTVPSTPSTPDVWDDGQKNVSWDNDTRFDFAWPAASDPNSGIADYRITLHDNTAGFYPYNDISAGKLTSLSLCPSGCNKSFTPVHNHNYWFRIQARNGEFPKISNQRGAYSAVRYIAVDLVNPQTAVTGPSAGSWQNGNFIVSLSDADDGSGIDSASCQYRVYDNGVPRVTSGRVPDLDQTVSVGPSTSTAWCRTQGVNTCRVDAYSKDKARRSSATASRLFSIDYSGDAIAYITARTHAGGAIILDDEETTDRDPYFQFGVEVGNRFAPITCYSWAIDVIPGCETCSTGGGDDQALQLANDALSIGVHEFNVRALDDAGNCGAVATFVINVKTKTADTNFDCDVDSWDLFRLVDEYGRDDCYEDCVADYNEDGMVNEDDLSDFASNYGINECPQP